MAASLAAGLYGVCAGLEPTAPTVGNAYDDGGAPALPRDLRSASARMRESDVAREWFGDTFVEHFCMTREWECREFDRAVTDWELRRYLEII
jgi:glutamine synthetase